ncbi:helix-turn-helix domain-containing protein [Rhodococcus sp. IEGM 1401]|uniref:helix-turn-helix domain-containing protein n=1 Tax=unclassified Rhodococcus (in: high G+C Gram-positive bacteria) TaxID=192944 RepID=UPI0022B5B493|nr:MULTISPECIES: helix-turn-helix domain-containing protein [unclassified Rhodococcus (in: high G+C Gram-positive bacteria)]MCZ4560705.1 helix-turn-helix domain-containing protein [Rhodococcus sp. IEGM 1401]MDI9920833.1 helix-turn-helix domain-containing protein [Rhodococcus sp. IEGM 1372]MDV8033130.1 helix-turn-helix domain-containing protein [Rhodococcus sp. IEGM 1414]
MPTFTIEHPIDPNLVTREVAAAALGCSLPTVQKHIDLKHLTGYRLPVGRMTLVDRREVEALVAQREKQA